LYSGRRKINILFYSILFYSILRNPLPAANHPLFI
jgi:hypothetical protein